MNEQFDDNIDAIIVNWLVVGYLPQFNVECEKLINKQIKSIEIVMANATQETVCLFVCCCYSLQNSFHG